MTGFRFRRADVLIAVGALRHLQLQLFEIDVGPPEAAQLARPQPGEDRRQEERPPLAVDGLDDGLDLGRGGDVDADLELALLAPVCTPLLAAAPPRSQLTH